ncbi:hypothetical protein O181_045001 [Austropuccinia psidii MF-1]|uniref:Ribosomal protein L17 n=1 Tax=Austropuccinia psidii MF-1 TaxID=1389203 RepID=A0A9Q3HHC9_9BASI|nr:hypothetical protein [Austropuccinia psidii MF-1]
MRLAKLNRTMSHRNAMFRNMVSALIEHEQIKTTFPKAKAISRLAERVITWSKIGTDNIFYQRKAESYLMNWVRVRQHLFHNLAKRYEHRAGGYTRIHRLGFRTNDHAPLAVIELVDNAFDLKRDKVIRTISRELAQIEISQKAKSENPTNNNKIKIPVAVWRNIPCKSELEAKKAIEEFQMLLPQLTRKNLQKVLSEPYVNAYQYCQPPQIPTKEEAMAQVAQARKLRRELLGKVIAEKTASEASATSNDTSSSLLKTSISLPRFNTAAKPKVGNLAHVKGIPRPIGAYTDFLYHIRLHFHRNLALFDPSKLGRVKRGIPASEHNGGRSTLSRIISFEDQEHAHHTIDPFADRPPTQHRSQRARRSLFTIKNNVLAKNPASTLLSI